MWLYYARVHYPYIPACLGCISGFVATHRVSYVATTTVCI